MKVKVGDKVYDSTVVPVMVILTSKDKDNIANMAPDATRYAEAPSSMDREKLLKWMRED